MSMEKRRFQSSDYEETYYPKKRLHRSLAKERKHKHSKKESDQLEPDEYEVEAILDIKRDEITGKRMYLIKWKGKNLNCPEKISEYLIRNKERISSKNLDVKGKHSKPIFTEEQFQKKLNDLQNKISYKNRRPKPMSPRTKNMIKRYDDEKERMLQQERLEKEAREKEERDRKMWEELKSIKPRKYSQLKNLDQEDNDSLYSEIEDSESYSPGLPQGQSNELRRNIDDPYLIVPVYDSHSMNNNSVTLNPLNADISNSAPPSLNFDLSEILSKIRREEDLLKSLQEANINFSNLNSNPISSWNPDNRIERGINSNIGTRKMWKLYQKKISNSNELEFISDIGLNLLNKHKIDFKFMEALSEKESVVIESSQPMKFLWRIFEEDMKRTFEDRSNHPLYTIFTVTAPPTTSNDLDHESRELRKSDQVFLHTYTSNRENFILSRPSLCNQLRIPIPHEVFLLVGYRKYVFPVNFLVNWSTHMLSTFADSKYILIGKKFIENDNLLRFLHFLEAIETYIEDPHLEIVMIHPEAFEETPLSPLFKHFISLKYRKGIKFYLFHETLPKEILISGGILTITVRALLMYDNIVEIVKGFLNKNVNWICKIHGEIFKYLDSQIESCNNANIKQRIKNARDKLNRGVVELKFRYFDEKELADDLIDGSSYCYSSMTKAYYLHRESYRYFVVIDDYKSMQYVLTCGVESMDLKEFINQKFV
ncbi:5148_t:CDS:10 [Acaulospora morrowiae]|uniref:5148_t:CDS:1 n=1 Tax=Acaulospora morrowiae TaxID=94023 RepID=A0A9N8V5M6_9GLOM|nr:5148_t:CDS:10 [Acaulospora morrowiae]